MALSTPLELYEIATVTAEIFENGDSAVICLFRRPGKLHLPST